MKKTALILFACVVSAGTFAQTKKGGKSGNPVQDVPVVTSEKELNDVLTKKFAFTERAAYYELSDAVAHADQVTTLKLNRLGLTEIPKEIALFKNLVELDLSNNKITSIGGKLSGLNNLQVLNLSSNALTEVPSELCNLPSLLSLNLSSNKISSGSFSCTKLERLYLNNNELTSLPSGIAQMKNLRGLYLHSNKLTSLDESLLKITTLEVLLVQFNKIAEEPTPYQHNGIINYVFYPQIVNERYLYKAFYSGPVASARSAYNVDDQPSQSDGANIANLSALVGFGDKIEDYKYNIRTVDAGNGFRRVKIGNHDYRRYSKFRVNILMPVGFIVPFCPLSFSLVHWAISKQHRNNYRLSNIYYCQERVDKIIAKGPTNLRIKMVNNRNKQIVGIYKRYLRSNKLKAN